MLVDGYSLDCARASPLVRPVTEAICDVAAKTALVGYLDVSLGASKAGFVGEDYGLDAVAQAEFGHGVGKVCLDGGLADEQGSGDLRVRHTRGTVRADRAGTRRTAPRPFGAAISRSKSSWDTAADPGRRFIRVEDAPRARPAARPAARCRCQAARLSRGPTNETPELLRFSGTSPHHG